MAPQGQVQIDAAKSMVVFHKTRMCHFFQQGCCSRGTQCKFAHSPSELRDTPDFSCTRLCERLIATGSCDIKGCKFAHNKQELRHRKPTAEEMAAHGAVESQKATTSKRRRRNGKAKAQAQVDSDDEITLSAGSFSRQTTEDLLELGASSWARYTSTGSSSTDASWSSLAGISRPMDEMVDAGKEAEGSILGVEAMVKNSFLHFGPSAAMPLGKRASSAPPSRSVC
mmetsp:Transcript_26208/g.60509  ORF Transcript_26208/g.60509 Transcript_26208/m.60509 type:complete len:226 (+) Transcript_26208:101-778(+)